ncbi:hypothetical protein [Teichococcus vastitatis]|jgi:hypothetical protein|uniref:Uncharacterized protein n=1 Tax=Teichococcus vastitatis TaxID=2307076 RepID=A0ABS9WAZ2_9PROT|nr:hypothetical protein [Pseudoroseomonas vastitatis]MCI0756472.1 hypothetical protein [Pseudoroseomonas vastitatis]
MAESADTALASACLGLPAGPLDATPAMLASLLFSAFGLLGLAFCGVVSG